MHIRALIPPGIDEIIVNGLHQWDYGRTLEIECAEFGTEVMEVHFACMGMIVAETRLCNFTNGIGAVTIPDKCLEQSTPITAWIYGLDTDKGRTIKTIRLPIIERTKPIRMHDVPTELVDRYNELAVAAEEAVEALLAGEVKAARATHADNADHADTANHAENATHATVATRAEQADYAPLGGSMSLKLLTTITIEAGISTGSNEINTLVGQPYLVVYESNNGWVGSGVCMGCGSYRLNEAYGSLHYNLGFEINPTGANIIKNTSTVDTSENGTLKIYSFGGPLY